MTTEERIEKLDRARSGIEKCGGEKAVAQQHAKGKYTARERIGLLLDPGSFHEIGIFARHQCVDFGMAGRQIPADGVVTGYGLVEGRKVFVYAQDFTSAGGSMGKMQAAKICRILDLAAASGAPVIGINDSGGARIQEGVDAQAGYGEIFRRIARNSGRIPQITMIMGPCAGGAAYAPAMTDLVVMTEGQGHMFCTGPGVIKDVTGEVVDAMALGGAQVHATMTGEVHLTAATEEEAFALVRRVLGYLPSSCREKPPLRRCALVLPQREPALLRREHSVAADAGSGREPEGPVEPSGKAFSVELSCGAVPAEPSGGDVPVEPSRGAFSVERGCGAAELRPALDTIMPDSSKQPYDMLDVIAEIADAGSFLELQPLFADNLLTGFARIAGRPVGILASQPYIMGGSLDMDAADKGARFVNLCDAFNLPLISLMDVPGFLPGVGQEHRGLLRHGAKMLYAFAVAEVPKITVILRKAYGGAYMAMGSREMGADLVLAWPSAEIAVMGAEGAVNVICRKEIAQAQDPAAKRTELAAAYTEKFSNPYFAAGKGYIDAVIRPGETRAEIISALALLEDKPHLGHRGNMPL